MTCTLLVLHVVEFPFVIVRWLHAYVPDLDMSCLTSGIFKVEEHKNPQTRATGKKISMDEPLVPFPLLMFN